MIRYPVEREAEALKLFGTISASHRMDPIWEQARQGFLTRLGNIEHAGRMEVCDYRANKVRLTRKRKAIRQTRA